MKQLNQRVYDELDVALMNTTNAISEYHGKINNNSLPTDSQQRKQTPDKDYRTVVIVKYGILSRTLTWRS
ncbi:MAG: hypothetical protein MOP50_1046 [Nitrososphaera sp.]|nr:hypothetical protein [Nitrososphaera sp.]